MAEIRTSIIKIDNWNMYMYVNADVNTSQPSSYHAARVRKKWTIISNTNAADYCFVKSDKMGIFSRTHVISTYLLDQQGNRHDISSIIINKNNSKIKLLIPKQKTWSRDKKSKTMYQIYRYFKKKQVNQVFLTIPDITFLPFTFPDNKNFLLFDNEEAIPSPFNFQIPNLSIGHHIFEMASLCKKHTTFIIQYDTKLISDKNAFAIALSRITHKR